MNPLTGSSLWETVDTLVLLYGLLLPILAAIGAGLGASRKKDKG